MQSICIHMANSLEKKKITKKKRNSNISDIADFMETFQDNIFQSIKKKKRKCANNIDRL